MGETDKQVLEAHAIPLRTGESLKASQPAGGLGCPSM
jgi:hypothetical protein